MIQPGALKTSWITNDYQTSSLIQKINSVNYKDITIKNNLVSINQDQLIDLGSIVKGYSSDLLNNFFVTNQEENVHINLGGNLHIRSTTPYKIGITDPFKSIEQIGYISLFSNHAIITSGIYERYQTYNQKIYHHILDPKTELPVNNEIISVTVVSKKGIDGDALSTSFLSAGLEAALTYLEKQDNLEAIFILKNKTIYITEFNYSLNFHKSKDSKYVYKKIKSQVPK